MFHTETRGQFLFSESQSLCGKNDEHVFGHRYRQHEHVGGVLPQRAGFECRAVQVAV